MRKRLIKFGAILMGAAIIMSGYGIKPVNAQSVRTGHTETESGKWVKDWERKYDSEKKKNYYENVQTGERLSPGWNQVDGSDYYIEEDGYISDMDIYQNKINGVLLYRIIDENGVEQIEAYKAPFTRGSDANGSYIADANGIKLCQDYTSKYEWLTYNIDGVEYIVNKSGYLYVDEWIPDTYTTESLTYTTWKYGDKEGKMAVGWTQIDEDWYYFDEFGLLCFGGCYDIKNDEDVTEYYLLGSDGKLITEPGWHECQNYYDSKWYYIEEDGTICEGWKEIDGEWYFFGTQGPMFTDGAWNCSGSVDIDDYYVFNKDGTLADEGWYHEVTSDGEDHWYYADKDSKAAIGWKPIDGAWYYFGKYGNMLTDIWQDGYYIGKDGVMNTEITGQWYQDEKGWYFMDSTGWYPSNEEYRIDGHYYDFDADGYVIED